MKEINIESSNEKQRKAFKSSFQLIVFPSKPQGHTFKRISQMGKRKTSINK